MKLSVEIECSDNLTYEKQSKEILNALKDLTNLTKNNILKPKGMLLNKEHTCIGLYKFDKVDE